MRVLFDTNVILDVLLDREPFSRSASALLTKVEKGEITGLVCAASVTTIYYLVNKAYSREKATECIEFLLALMEIAPVNRVVVDTAFKQKRFRDFEDAVIYASAVHSGCSCVVTRNISDFPASEIPVFLPDELLKLLNARKK